MHKTIENLNYIQNQINSKIFKLNINNYNPKIVAISKTFKIDHILPLIGHGHRDFGENKVQEAIEKWTEIKSKNKEIRLHMVGKLQTNKVKFVLPLFDFIHSLDNLKLAKKISDEQKKHKIKPKIFIQINIGNEPQKTGIIKSQLTEFYNECLNLGLDIVGSVVALVSKLGSEGLVVLLAIWVLSFIGIKFSLIFSPNIDIILLFNDSSFR